MKKGETLTHLVRGAECVRSWSKYKQTDFAWSLCGRRQDLGPPAISGCVEEPGKVNCSYCVELMHPGACAEAATPCSFCEATKAQESLRVKET